MSRIGKPARNLKHKPRMSRRVTPRGIVGSINKMNLSQLKRAKYQTANNNNIDDGLKRTIFAAISARENKIRTCLDGKRESTLWK